MIIKTVELFKNKYQIGRVLYFGGVEIHNFQYNYLNNTTVPIIELEKHLVDLVKNKANQLNEAELVLIARHLQRTRFYLKITKIRV